ncbi:GDSL-type esterase/lipase family protein [Halobacillus salinarum]|uniref:GDSL-type esterase/lipase family protein n=1 Tax=Halobacillus salinarum TaxID=2932257 RepID=A0ABY4EKW5_9BACI|nr:GDSL-type esterase/lipase family protein [Halobacillus salinarum]UOQ45112.1 GDSL-type esterase/lipase family protein [Halobacillus salinarum]
MKPMKVILVILMITQLLTPFSAEAKEGGHLVAIGDSIPYGYNLTVDNKMPSGAAFPYLIGNKAGLEVTNLGIPGLTSKELLQAVKTNKVFRETIRDADYVLVYIGGNDLLNVVKKNKGLKNVTVEEIAPVIRDLLFNVYGTILTLDKLTDAKIIVYNIYNPYPAAGDKLNTPLSYINKQYASLVELLSHFTEVKLVNAYKAFKGHPEYILPKDVHPTSEGQKVLARIGLRALHS